MEVEVCGKTELNAVAGLLGISPQSLFRGLTSRTHNTLGQVVKTYCDANMVRIKSVWYCYNGFGKGFRDVLWFFLSKFKIEKSEGVLSRSADLYRL